MWVGQEMILTRVQALEEREKLGEREGNWPRTCGYVFWWFVCLFV